MLRAVKEAVPVQQLAVHFHDTYGQVGGREWLGW
jgi:hypothetical protein